MLLLGVKTALKPEGFSLENSLLRTFFNGSSFATFSLRTYLAMSTDLPVKPFPKEFNVCREMHVTFIACGIGHAENEGSKDKVSSVRSGFPGGNQC